jgi:hypothetical protein
VLRLRINAFPFHSCQPLIKSAIADWTKAIFGSEPEGHIWKWTNLSLVDLGTKMQTKFGGFIHSCLPWCNLWALIYLTNPTFDCNISINDFWQVYMKKLSKNDITPRKTHAEEYGKTFLNNLRLVKCRRESPSVLANQRINMRSHGVYI